jgi:excinuclease ABC subunit A
MAKKKVEALDEIIIVGAQEHNLKNITVRIPKNELTVLTGVSGSGKSSLAFDTLYAEGQRRYVESLSSYARQFLGQMEKPHYEQIRGLAPTISIEQKTSSKNPRSTVGTITEIYDYLRVLFARVGVQHCTKCGNEVTRQSAEQIARNISEFPKGNKALILSPVIKNKKGEHREIIESLKHEGFVRARIDGLVVDLDSDIRLKKTFKHSIDLVVDRLVLNGWDDRLIEAVETGLKFGSGKLTLQIVDGEEYLYSEDLACPECSLSFPELSPQSFSFNSPLGMCVKCNGLGWRLEMDAEKVLEDENLSLKEGALIPWARRMKRGRGWSFRFVKALCDGYEVDMNMPWKKIPKAKKDMLLYGTGLGSFKMGRRRRNMSYPGLLNNMMAKFLEATSDKIKEHYNQYLTYQFCDNCEGTRLRKESRAVKCGGRLLEEIVSMTIDESAEALETLKLSGNQKKIAKELMKELGGRLGFLLDVGLNYLSLDRSGPTLSGGESQRIRLASQVGSELTGVVYVLDEPSIGLHPRDNARLIKTLKHLRDIGNTVVVVEHDQETIEAADHMIDFGPGAGRFGGEVVFAGTPADCKKNKDSLTGAYLSGRKKIEYPAQRRKGNGKTLTVQGAKGNNLKNIDVDFPLGCFIAVTGVSGAGKSSLINDILYPATMKHLHDSAGKIAEHKAIKGLKHIDKVIRIDQSPIGRTPRSNPATYVKLFDPIRELFSQLKQSKVAGYTPGRFSFNVKGGRCEACSGDGMRRIEMHFLPDIFVTCEECGGKRFNESTLRIKFKSLNIAEVLDLTVGEALEVFATHPNINKKLQTLVDVGLDYVKLGQPSTTLSGGEAQRIKLSRELAKRQTGQTLYLLDEPTTGLHFDDVRKLLIVLQRLVEQGNTVVVIEHNLDVIKCSDHVIDIGPDGGKAGGKLIAEGTPEEVSKNKKSRTGPFLKALLSAPKTKKKKKKQS